MAIVGEARIIVRADTSAVKEQIRKGFAGSEKVAADAGDAVSKSFSDGFGKNKKYVSSFAKDSEKLARSFHQAIRNSYKWQAATGALIQSIAALGSGLLALAGNIGGTVAAGGALVGLMAQMKVTSLVAKQAFHGIMQAVTASTGTSKQSIKQLREEMQQLAFAAEEAALGEEEAALKLEKAREELARSQSLPPDNRARREAELAYQQADLAYRKAKDKASDALDKVQNPPKKRAAGADPFAQLTKTQRQFAIYLKSVMPKLKELREAAASSFLPTLTEQMKIMFQGGFFDMLVKGFGEVSKGLSQATKAFSKTLFDPSTKNNLAEFFKNSGRTAGIMGSVLGNAFSGFLTFMKAIDPLISKFTNFLNTKTNAFAENMKANYGPISAFFKNAGTAAAGWGAILGRIFEKFKNVIKANIGPGTGGQMLLDWMNQGTTGFRGLDGAAGEFARKNYFLAAATNFKAIMESLGQIFSFMSGLAADPAIAGFWNTLSALEAPLNEIFNSIMGSSDELANMLVSIVEIIAAFADAGQLRAYMEAVSAALKGLTNVVNTLKPIMQVLGWFIGKVGASVTILIVLKNAMKLVTGTTIILGRAWAFGATYVKAYAMAQKMATVQMTLGMRLQKSIIALTTAEGRAKLWASLKSLFAAGAKGAEAVATGALGTASGAATGPVASLAVAINSAIWPLTLIVVALAAVVAVIIAVVSAINGINADNAKKAMKGMDASFKSTRGHALGAAEAQNMWTQSLLSVADYAKDGITDVRQLGKALSESNAGTTAYESATTALNTYMTSLSKVTKKSLPESQRQFRNMIVVGGLSRAETEKAITSNSDYTAALEKQAKAMGDTIYNMDGTINKQKAVDYAIGEGTYLVRKAAIERDKLNQTLRDSYNSFIDLNGPLQQSADDLKGYSDAIIDTTTKTGFSLKKYVKDITGQGDKADEWMKRMTALAGSMSGDMYAKLAAMGKDGMGLVQSLTTIKNGIVTVNKEALADYAASAAKMAEAQEKMKNLTAALTGTQALQAAISKKMGSSMNMTGVGQWVTGILKQVEDGQLTVLDAAKQAGVSVDDLINAQKGLKKEDLASKVNISAAWDTGTLDTLRTQLVEKVGDVTLTIKKKDGGQIGTVVQDVVGPWTGGLIWNNSLIKKFADGGRVYGPGGPVDDRVPAMLSNGEFVVNSAATSKNLALLNMINQSKQSASMAGPQNNVHMTINAAPGMDEQEIANLVSAKLNFELSRGMNA